MTAVCVERSNKPVGLLLCQGLEAVSIYGSHKALRLVIRCRINIPHDIFKREGLWANNDGSVAGVPKIL